MNNLLNNSMRACLTTVLVLIAGALSAQQFAWESKLDSVPATGFYRLVLTPDILARTNTSFSDIRVFDGAAKEVPYVLQTESPVYWTQLFKPYEIVEKKIEKGRTTLTLRNTYQTSINNISLIIKNADVTKKASLLGSDDKAAWYAVRDAFLISSVSNNQETAEIKLLNFPLSNYTYYRLVIQDSAQAPLNILRAGFYDFQQAQGQYMAIPAPAVTTRDSASEKSTYHWITFDKPYQLDQLEFTFAGAPFFLRRGELRVKETFKNKKGKPEVYYSTLQSFDVSSGSPCVLALDRKITEVLLVVHNDDNPPLALTAVLPRQLNRYLALWLEPGQSYIVRTGNETLTAPQYDLSYFTEKIPAQPPAITMGSWVSLLSPASEPATFFTSNRIIWIALVGVLALLGFMTMRLVGDMGKKEPE